jgi:hypothetical protein
LELIGGGGGELVGLGAAGDIDTEGNPVGKLPDGLSTSDKIALGLGIGIGLPATIAAISTCCYQLTSRRRFDCRRGM